MMTFKEFLSITWNLNVLLCENKFARVIMFLPILIAHACFLLIVLYLFRKVEESKRYRKVIKKGLFWDTEYWIEK